MDDTAVTSTTWGTEAGAEASGRPVREIVVGVDGSAAAAAALRWAAVGTGQRADPRTATAILSGCPGADGRTQWAPTTSDEDSSTSASMSPRLIARPACRTRAAAGTR